MPKNGAVRVEEEHAHFFPFDLKELRVDCAKSLERFISESRPRRCSKYRPCQAKHGNRDEWYVPCLAGRHGERSRVARTCWKGKRSPGHAVGEMSACRKMCCTGIW